MIEGIVYKYRNNPKPPDIIFAKKFFYNVIGPNNLVSYSSSNYGGWRHEKMTTGEHGVYLFIKVRDEEIHEKLKNNSIRR